MNVKKVLLLLIFVSVVFYLAGSICAASFSIHNCSSDVRCLLAFLWLVTSLLVVFIPVVDASVESKDK